MRGKQGPPPSYELTVEIRCGRTAGASAVGMPFGVDGPGCLKENLSRSLLVVRRRHVVAT